MARAAPFKRRIEADTLTSVELGPMSSAEYLQFALEHDDQSWELHEGRPRTKPTMTWDHNDVAFTLGFLLGEQIDWGEFRVRVNASRVYRPEATYYIPDVLVVPVELGESLRGRSDTLESFTEALPLVVEVWSPSTGDYDTNEKLPTYQARGDLETWRIHPYDRTITAWRRQPDGSYEATPHHEGLLPVSSLSGVSIDLAKLFQG